MVFFPHWLQAGIKQISELFYSCEGQFLLFNSFRNVTARYTRSGRLSKKLNELDLEWYPVGTLREYL